MAHHSHLVYKNERMNLGEVTSILSDPLLFPVLSVKQEK